MSNPTSLAGGDRIHSSSEDEMTGADQNRKEVGSMIESLVHSIVGRPKNTWRRIVDKERRAFG